MLSLKGKSAIISGGSKGIGKAIAFTFAKAGANVLFVAEKKIIWKPQLKKQNCKVFI